jgi:hypothetical protein
VTKENLVLWEVMVNQVPEVLQVNLDLKVYKECLGLQAQWVLLDHL